MSNIFAKYGKKAEREFLSHVSKDIQELVSSLNGRKIDHEEYQTLLMNSYERKYLLPHISRECLLKNLEYYLSQCQANVSRHHVCSTYDEAILCDLIPQLLKLLKEQP